MTLKTASSANARAPFLRVVKDDAQIAPETAQDAARESAPGQLVLTSYGMFDINPLGRGDSSILRIVSWQQETGLWRLGVLEEKWPRDRLGQGEPESFRLWQTGQEFSMQAMAQDHVRFWSANKVVSDVRRQLLGQREFHEPAVPVPPVIADSAKGQSLPFSRPPLRSRHTLAREAVLRHN